MKRSEFIGRVAGGAFAVSTASAMTDEGPFAPRKFKLSALSQGSRTREKSSLPFNHMPTISPSSLAGWCSN